MRAQLIQALRDYYPDADDATTAGRVLVPIGGGIAGDDPHRLTRLLLRGLREQEQELRDLRQRVAALEVKVP